MNDVYSVQINACIWGNHSLCHVRAQEASRNRFVGTYVNCNHGLNITLHTAAHAVRLAVETGLSFPYDTIVVLFFAAYKKKDNAEVALVTANTDLRILDVTV